MKSLREIEKCEKCGAFRTFTLYESGLREKAVYTPRKVFYGAKCRHKWKPIMKVLKGNGIFDEVEEDVEKEETKGVENID